MRSPGMATLSQHSISTARRMAVVVLLLLLVVGHGGLGRAQQPDEEEGPADECAQGKLVELVTACAQENPKFIKCVSSGIPGSRQQCECIRQSASMQTCIDTCLGRVYETLCIDWQPSSSKYLEYKAERPPLKGIDGIYVVSLARRRDRLEAFFRESRLSPREVQVVEGFDGQALAWSDGLRSLFRDNQFGSRRAVAGCALSHFLLWRHIAATTGEYHLVFEDDARLNDPKMDLAAVWNERYHWAFPVRSDLVFLGGLRKQNEEVYRSGEVVRSVSRAFAEHLPNRYFKHTFDPLLDEGDADDDPAVFHYFASSYVLSSAGAKALVAMVADAGFRLPTDQMLLRLMRKATTYATVPLLFHEPEGIPNLASGVDSDILHDYEVIPDKLPPPPPSAVQQQAAEPPPPPPPPSEAAAPSVNTFEVARVPTFVINLNHSSTRLAHFEAEAAKAKINFHRFPATLGTTVDIERLKSGSVLAESFPAYLYGTVGQAVSHLLLYEALADGGFDAMMVFEDDVAFLPNFHEQVNALLLDAQQGAVDWDIISLACEPGCGTPEPGRQLYTAAPECGFGMHAYLVNKQSAKKMLRAAVPLAGPLRAQIARSLTTGIAGFCSSSNLVVEAEGLSKERARMDSEGLNGSPDGAVQDTGAPTDQEQAGVAPSEPEPVAEEVPTASPQTPPSTSPGEDEHAAEPVPMPPGTEAAPEARRHGDAPPPADAPPHDGAPPHGGAPLQDDAPPHTPPHGDAPGEAPVDVMQQMPGEPAAGEEPAAPSEQAGIPPHTDL